MVRDSVILQLLRRAGNRTGDTVLAASILGEMTLVQEMLDQWPQKFWFQLSEWASATVTEDERRLGIPIDMLQEYSEGTLEIYSSADAAWKPVVKDTLEILEARFRGDNNGRPTKYATSGGYFILFPSPDMQYSARMRYYKAAASISGTYGGSGNIENVWLKYASDWFIALAGERMMRYLLSDLAKADLYKQDALMAQQRVEHAQVAWEEANRERNMGDGA